MLRLVTVLSHRRTFCQLPTNLEHAVKFINTAFHQSNLLLDAENKPQIQDAVKCVDSLISRPNLLPAHHLFVSKSLYLGIAPHHSATFAFSHACSAGKITDDTETQFVCALLCLTGANHKNIETFDDDDEPEFVAVQDPETGAVRLVERDADPSQVPVPEHPRQVVKEIVQKSREQREAEKAVGDVAVDCSAQTSGQTSALEKEPVDGPHSCQRPFDYNRIQPRKNVPLGLELLQLASRSLPHAQLMLGNLMISGRAVPMNEAVGLQLLRLAAEHLAAAKGMLAYHQIMSLDESSPNNTDGAKQIISLLQQAEAESDPFATFLLYVCYLNGLGVSADPVMSLNKLQKAADLKCPAALYHLSLRYLNGEDVPQSTEKFLSLAQSAALYGDSEAAFCLGHIYFHGSDGLTIDYVKARRYFDMAAKQRHADALCSLAAMHYHGQGGPVDRQMAFELYQKAALRDSVEAWRNLGAMYLNGEGVAKCEQTAQHFFNLVERVEKGEIQL